jgi:uncharacterized repeat protein (TIGR03803 family)
MKRCLPPSFLHYSLAVLSVVAMGRLSAQSFTVLHNFTGLATNSVGVYTNADGAVTTPGLVLSGNLLYGIACNGGASGNGTVFAINTDGTGFKVLHSFSSLNNGTNDDGSCASSFSNNGTFYFPAQHPGLAFSDGILYGTTAAGGFSGGGTVFALSADGTTFTNLHNFSLTNSEGNSPRGSLVLSSHVLYGTTAGNTLFALKIDGTGFTNLHSFGYDDGVSPNGLILSDSTLYGTTYFGGGDPFITPYGTVFALSINGSDFTVLHSFGTGGDGSPQSGVVASSGFLYGTSPGVIYRVSTNGTGYWILHNFESSGYSHGGLVLSGNTLYGTTPSEGYARNGTVFSINTEGQGFTNLYEFTATSPDGSFTNSDGANSLGELVLSGSTLYGATSSGGSNGSGTLFKFIIRPQLTILPAGTEVVLAWPTNALGFALQSTSRFGPQTSWTNVSQPPVVLNGQNVVILPSSPQRFYRLIQ